MKQDIEQFVVIPTESSEFSSALSYLDQCVRAFRSDSSELPSGDESLISVDYRHDTRDVLVASSAPGRVLVQIQDRDNRQAFTYDIDREHPVIVNEFVDSSSDEPSRSFALKPIPANVPLLLDLCDYIQRAANHGKDS